MDRLQGDWLPKIKGQDLLGLGEAMAWIFPQRVGLGLLALPEVQCTLRREEKEGVCRDRARWPGNKGLLSPSPEFIYASGP